MDDSLFIAADGDRVMVEVATHSFDILSLFDDGLEEMAMAVVL